MAPDKTAAEDLIAAVQAGINAKCQQQTSDTALISAALHGNETHVRLLLEHGGDTTVRAEDGRTALDLALEDGHTDLAESLPG